MVQELEEDVGAADLQRCVVEVLSAGAAAADGNDLGVLQVQGCKLPARRISRGREPVDFRGCLAWHRGGRASLAWRRVPNITFCVLVD